MKIHNLMTPDMIIPELESADREGALREMVGFLKKRRKITKERELYDKLLQREMLGSTAIKEGVAIPHCKIKGVNQPIVLLAISKEGVDFYSLDGQPSKIFFLVVSSPDNPSLNLQILASIAHLVRKTNSLLKKFLGAENINLILDVIRDEEDKLYG